MAAAGRTEGRKEEALTSDRSGGVEAKGNDAVEK